MNQTGIIWTEATWNPMSGCQKISAGCKHCYAFELAESKRGTKAFPNGFDLTIRPHKLIEPSKLKTSRVIFVNSMSDLFYEKVSDDYRGQIIDVIENNPQHEFQVLTKRPESMLEYSKKRKLPANFWAGVSVENEQTKSRIEILKQVECEIRFVSMEPLLGNINLQDNDLEGIHWVITGGESGKHLWKGHICEERALVRFNQTSGKWEVREDRIAWVRDVKDFCTSHNVKYFHKQWGGLKPESAGRELDGQFWSEIPRLPGQRSRIQNQYLDFLEAPRVAKDKEQNLTIATEFKDFKCEHPGETSSRPNEKVEHKPDIRHRKDLFAMTYSEMREIVKSRPKEKTLWGIIKENSVGLIIGPSGAGKSICSENLAMSLASGATEYLGLPISGTTPRVVLSISLEESCNPRTDRNELQVPRVIAKHGTDWMNRWFVVDERMPQFLSTESDFDIIRNLINELEADILILDSLTHLCNGPIEDSSVSTKMMSRFRSLANVRPCTIIGIHHTYKLVDLPLTIQTVAGSRVVGQECDFIIGINTLSNGKRYLKPVKSRYSRATTSVIEFTIEDDCWLKVQGNMEEYEMLASLDCRFNSSNKDQILSFINERCQKKEDVITVQELIEKFKISKVTIQHHLKDLVNEKKIVRISHGKYGSITAA